MKYKDIEKQLKKRFFENAELSGREVILTFDNKNNEYNIYSVYKDDSIQYEDIIYRLETGDYQIKEYYNTGDDVTFDWKDISSVDRYFEDFSIMVDVRRALEDYFKDKYKDCETGDIIKDSDIYSIFEELISNSSEFDQYIDKYKKFRKDYYEPVVYTMF
jgi:hypothetical protein